MFPLKVDYMELTKYELARLIGARALQLASGAPPMIKPKSHMSVIQVAEAELSSDSIPLVVLRQKEN